MSSSIFVKGALAELSQKHPDSSHELAISIQELNAWYGQDQALRDINLDIERHCITAFIGPSGCGKTTLLRCLNRMNDLNREFRLSGLIELAGKNIYGSEYPVGTLRKQVGMVFQDANPFPMSIYNNLLLPLNENHANLDRKLARQIIIEKLQAAGLYEEVQHRLHQSALKLSGGQQQRLCIARALTIEPEIILLDEPCSALDPVSTAKIESLLLALKEQYSIIIVTHNLQQAARIADYVVFFYEGEIVEQGVAEEFFVNPQKQQTENYLRGVF